MSGAGGGVGAAAEAAGQGGVELEGSGDCWRWVSVALYTPGMPAV